MAGLGDLLMRIRRRWAPPGGVDHPASPLVSDNPVADELAPLFAEIDAIEEEAEAIRTEGQKHAQVIRERAGRQAERVIAEAPGRAAAARTSAMASVRAVHEREIARLQQDSRAEAATVRQRAAERLPELSSQVVRRVLAAFEEDASGGGVADAG